MYIFRFPLHMTQFVGDRKSCCQSIFLHNGAGRWFAHRSQFRQTQSIAFIIDLGTANLFAIVSSWLILIILLMEFIKTYRVNNKATSCFFRECRVT